MFSSGGTITQEWQRKGTLPNAVTGHPIMTELCGTFRGCWRHRTHVTQPARCKLFNFSNVDGHGSHDGLQDR